MAAVRMTQVTALVLRAVDAGYQYGFDIMEVCGLPSGTVYPALRRLEKAGLLGARWESADAAHLAGRPPRRVYELTEEGQLTLPQALQKLSARRQVLGDLVTPSERRAR